MCRRWCTVCMALVYGVYGVGVRCVWRWCTVYGVQALGVRCAGVGCTCVCRYIDVVSVCRIRPIKTKHLKTIHQRYKTKDNEHKTNECLFNRIQTNVYIIYLNGS